MQESTYRASKRALLCLPLLLTIVALDAQQQAGGSPSDTRRGNPRLEMRLESLMPQTGAFVQSQDPTSENLTEDGEIVVVVEPRAGEASSTVSLASLRSAGARVLAQSEHLMRVAVPVSSLGAVAAVDGVRFVRLPQEPFEEGISEGVSLVEALDYHNVGIEGQGVKVAVIDGGFSGADGLAGVELPWIFTAVDFTGGGVYSGSTHGTACAEIIHDLAPRAELHLLRVSDLTDFENAKDYCIAQGIDIISHSLAWLNSGIGDGKGLACDIANNAVNADILFVNSAGNNALSHYGGTFASSDGDNRHDFIPGDEELGLLGVDAGELVMITLTWNDWPGTGNDYDLWLYDLQSGTMVASSANTQSSGSPPKETIAWTATTGGTYGVRITEWSSSEAEYLRLDSWNHMLAEHHTVAGSITTPTEAAGTFSVGAMDWRNWSSGAVAEIFSGRGPTFDGRVMPDIVGPDGVSTSSYGTGGFYGTSAAAPHVAGVAALVKSAYPSYSRLELEAELAAATVDVGVSGKDNTYGHGKLQIPPLSVVAELRVEVIEASSLSLNTPFQIVVSARNGNGDVVPGTVDWVVLGSNTTGLMFPAGPQSLSSGIDTFLVKAPLGEAGFAPEGVVVSAVCENLGLLGESAPVAIQVPIIDAPDSLVGIDFPNDDGRQVLLTFPYSDNHPGNPAAVSDPGVLHNPIDYYQIFRSDTLSSVTSDTLYNDSGNPSSDTHLVRGNQLDAPPMWGGTPGKSVTYDGSEVIYEYTGLDASLTYEVTVTYYEADGSGRTQRLVTDTGTELHGVRSLPDTPTPASYSIPSSETSDGSLGLHFLLVNGPNCVVSEITLVGSGSSSGSSSVSTGITWSVVPALPIAAGGPEQLSVVVPTYGDVGSFRYLVQAVKGPLPSGLVEVSGAVSGIAGKVLAAQQVSAFSMPAPIQASQPVGSALVAAIDNFSPGNLNADRWVDADDYGALLLQWGSRGVDPVFDLTQDRRINADDLSVWIRYLGDRRIDTPEEEAEDLPAVGGVASLVAERLSYSVLLEDVSSLSAYEVVFGFDPAAFEVDAVESHLSAPAVPPVWRQPVPGRIHVLAGYPLLQSQPLSAGPLVTVRFGQIGETTETIWLERVKVMKGRQFRDLLTTPQSVRPMSFTLYGNYPNPFNSNTMIPFDLAMRGPVHLSVHNLLGQRVRTLVAADAHEAGHFLTRWDGRDVLGNTVASGPYFIVLRAGDMRITKEAMLLK
jgi:subtilisin family serine protease